MISLSDAQQLIIEAVRELECSEISVEQASYYVASKDIISPIPVAPFRNSAMDGFAVASDYIAEMPATLTLATTIFAGDQLPPDTDKTKAMKIMTGAPVPDQYDTVIRIEDTSHDNKQVTINLPVQPGQNVRMPGEDIAEGEVVIKKGCVIRALDLGVLASIGFKTIPVIRKPRVLILSTGNELARAGRPLEFGQVYDSNSYTLAGMIGEFSASVEKHPTIADDISSLSSELSSDHDVIITSGGVSMGEKDYLPEVAEQCGWKPLFHKVAIKPGKPVFVATRGDQILFGLPGNPLSAAVTCAVLVLPALRKLIGIEECLPELRDASLDESSPMKSGRTVVWPGRIKHTDNKIIATLSGKRSSAALSALLDSDGLIFLDRDQPDSIPVVKVLKWKEIIHL